VTIAAWSFVLSYIFLFAIDLVPGLRVRCSEEDEILGLDAAVLREATYTTTDPDTISLDSVSMYIGVLALLLWLLTQVMWCVCGAGRAGVKAGSADAGGRGSAPCRRPHNQWRGVVRGYRWVCVCVCVCRSLARSLSFSLARALSLSLFSLSLSLSPLLVLSLSLSLSLSLCLCSDSFPVGFADGLLGKGESIQANLV
jgi:hypothetical protein